MKAKLLTTTVVSAIMFSGCDIKDTIYETAHPNHGTITLTTDWSATNIATTPSSGCAVRVGACSETLMGASKTLDYLFDPGDYTIYAYNTADGITVSSTTVTVATSGNHIDAQPGWLYTGAQAVSVKKDTDHKCTVAMSQQVRELTLVIEPTGGTTEDIATITGTLSGVAGSLDFASGTHATPSTVGLTFYPTAVPGDANWYAAVRLLGVTGAVQSLDITVTYNDGTPADQIEDYNLSALLTDFNSDKATPLTLGAQVVETPTESGFTATITDWRLVQGDNMIAE